ncbi:MAG: Trm112 family protein [Gammaproteobacteria bacterium]|nr:Trm112 family protein [Gammaproteobacteria bacterium]
MIDAALLNILVCPVSGAPVIYDRENNQLICHTSKLVYPIIDGIPVMLEEKAKPFVETQ